MFYIIQLQKKQWKIVSRGFQNTINNLIDQYGQGAINYFNSMKYSNYVIVGMEI